MKHVTVIGAGPAGASAALAALRHGAGVTLYDKSPSPRHKVCGEFLSGGVEPVLQSLRVWPDFLDASPARITTVEIHLGRRRLTSRLPAPAYGLSRFALDHLLRHAAEQRGAKLIQETGPAGVRPLVSATGRLAVAPPEQRGKRLFGFKAHFSGPAREAVELYFFDGCYVGLNAIENGFTNVCGLGPEHRLRAVAFDIDRLLRTCEPLGERLAPLARSFDWLTCGPLLFRNAFRDQPDEGIYLAGDRLQFVDPFTGSGMLSGILTGRLAGIAAAEGAPVQRHLQTCRSVLQQPFRWSTAVRWAATQPWAALAAEWIPTPWLYHLTRPHRL